MAFRRNRAARNRHQAARARHDMRYWQVEHRKRTRSLIEPGGLVVKTGLVELTGDDRAIIYARCSGWPKSSKAIRHERANVGRNGAVGPTAQA
jgi:hypothetical protein